MTLIVNKLVTFICDSCGAQNDMMNPKPRNHFHCNLCGSSNKIDAVIKPDKTPIKDRANEN